MSPASARRWRQAATGSAAAPTQARAALWTEIGDGLLTPFRAAPAVAARLADIEREVMTGTRTPADGARELLKTFRCDA